METIMTNESIVTPTKEGIGYVLRVDRYQLEEIKRALERMNKQRQHAQRWADNHRVLDTPKKNSKATKLRVVISDI